ncbi:MAG: ATP-binding protein [Thermodesulfobacteriota bacterium]|nr:ATP-binding protein [Thermodesulfobacteriota bacterium]
MTCKGFSWVFPFGRSLFTKITITIVFVIITSVSAVTYVSIHNQTKTLKRELINRNMLISEQVCFAIKNAFYSLNWVYVEDLLKKTVDAETVLWVYILTPEGEEYLGSKDADIADYKTLDRHSFDEDGMPERPFGISWLDDYTFSIFNPIQIGNQQWFLCMGITLQPIIKLREKAILEGVILATIIIWFGCMLSFFLSRKITLPITALAEATHNISRGDLDQKIEPNTNDEIGELSEDFNQMLSSLKAYRANLNEMVEEKTRDLQQALHDLKATQSRLVQSEKMASLGQLAAGVAHEINNPTGFIISNLGTLKKYTNRLMEFIDIQEKDHGPLDAKKDSDYIKEKRKALKIDYIKDDIQDLIAESLDGAKRVKEIVQNLKGFSRMDEVDYQPVDINECIETTLNIIWNEVKYKSTVIKDYGDIPVIKGYPRQLNQVFMNIIINAVHSIDKKGEIRIRTVQSGEWIKVTITDTGCGIPEDNLHRLFDPFFTTKEVGKGTGLGLSISYDIIKKHGGDITVQSEPEKGTIFTVSLPVV